MKGKKIVLWTLLISTAPVLNAQIRSMTETAYREGLQALDQMEYASALDKFNEVLYHQPDLAEGYFQRAAAKIGLKAYERALIDYNILLELEPEHHEGLYARAVLNYQLENYEASRGDFVRLNALPGGETNTIFFARPKYGGGVTGVHTLQGRNPGYIYNYLGLIEKELKQYDLALDYFDSALYYQPRQPDYYLNRGLTYQEKGELTLAEKDYRKVLSLNSDHALAKYNLATLMQQKGDEQGAEDYFSRAIITNPGSPYPYRQRGYRRIKAGDFHGALADLDNALKLDDADAETWLNKGIAEAKLKRWSGAVKSYSKVIELAPDFEKAYMNRGNTLYQLELYEEALQDYNAALTFAPDYGMAYYHRGLVYHKLGNDLKACEDLDKAIQQDIVPAAKAKRKICEGGM